MATAIGSADSVRLGMETTVTWSQINRLKHCRIIRIGRDADNDVVVSDEKVSGHHARLLIDEDQITLIDLESANGTAVGRPDQKTHRAAVSPADKVYFASNEFRVSQLLEATGAPSPTTSMNLRRRLTIGVVGATAAVLLIWATMFREQAPESVASGTTVSENVAEGISIERPEKQLSADERLQQALFAVVVRTAETEPGIRIGTAWAVAERKLATSGNVVLFLHQSVDEFPIITVQNVTDGREWQICDSIAHPVCRKNADRIKELGQQIENIQAELDGLSKNVDGTENAPTAEDSDHAKKLADQILTLDDQWFVSAEDMIHFDAGLLVTSESLARESEAVVLKIAENAPSRLAPVTIRGAAFPHDQSIIVDQSSLPMLQLDGTIEAFARYKRDSVLRPVLRCAAEHMQQNWLGAPALNSSGQVVGLYSRPTPSLQPNVPPDGDRCDIVSVERLTDLLTSLE